MSELVNKYRVQTVTELEDRVNLAEYDRFFYKASNKDYAYIKETVRRESARNCIIQRQDRVLTLASNSTHDIDSCKVMNKHLYKSGIDCAEFKQSVIDLLRCTHPKKNALYLFGPVNNGKSVIARAICDPFVQYIGTMSGCAGEHYFDDMLQKSIILLEELWTVQNIVDDYKSILSGYQIALNLKNVQKRSRLVRTPCIITSNYAELGRNFINSLDEAAVRERCYIFMFKEKFEPGRIIPYSDIRGWIVCANSKCTCIEID